jgi:hypothetical protein
MKHREAFCLITYVAELTSEKEVIWNSRDGRAPGSIVSRHGHGAKAFGDAVFAPDHVPEIGERIFVGMTEVRARMLAAKRIERWEQKGTPPGMPTLQDLFETREAAVQSAFEHIYDQTQPDILVVTAGYIEELQELRRRAPSHVETALVEPTAPTDPMDELGLWFDRDVQPLTFRQFTALKERDGYVRMGYTEINDDVHVSTVWLGNNHGFEGRPIIFETMVFRRRPTGVPADDDSFEPSEQYQYFTEAEALAGHERVVAKLNAAAELKAKKDN